MPELNTIKAKITEMSKLALKMWQTTHLTFIEHDADLISPILQDENRLNDLEKEITSLLIEHNKTASGAQERAAIPFYAEVVEDLELIGDYCKDVLERVEIKIQEKLLFSEEAVKEYEELYRRTEDALKEVTSALERGSFSAVKGVLRKDEHIDTLVDLYRKRHNQRMIEGLCSPMACNMFLNMLDFTAAVYYHTKKIAKNLLKLGR